MAKVLVTGGAGFIGSHIVDHLVAAGHEVRILDNLSSGSKKFIPKGVVLEEFDIRSSEAQQCVIKYAPDVIVHAAAQISVRISMDDPVLDTDINVMGLVNLLNPLRDKPKTHVIFLSSGGAMYGEQDSFPAPESHKVLPESVYGLAKHVSELYLDIWSRAWGLKATSLRLSNVYGPRQNPHGEAGVVAIFSRGLLQNKTVTINGDGEQTRDFIFVEDIARAVVAAVNKNLSGAFNIGTGVETSVNTLAQGIHEACNNSGKIAHAEAKKGEQRRSCIDPSKAKRELSWQASVKLNEGLKSTVDWFRKELELEKL